MRHIHFVAVNLKFDLDGTQQWDPSEKVRLIWLWSLTLQIETSQKQHAFLLHDLEPLHIEPYCLLEMS